MAKGEGGYCQHCGKDPYRRMEIDDTGMRELERDPGLLMRDIEQISFDDQSIVASTILKGEGDDG